MFLIIIFCFQQRKQYTNLFTTSELPKYSNSNCPNFVYFIFLLDQKQDQQSAAPSITLFTVPQKKCVFQKNQNKKNWRIGLFGGSDVVNKLCEMNKWLEIVVKWPFLSVAHFGKHPPHYFNSKTESSVSLFYLILR